MKLLKWLSVADRFSKIYLDEQLAPFGLNSSQHMYLLKICHHPGILQDALVNSFYVHPSNVVRTVAALEKSGFLTRVPYEKDKRTWRLFPTQKALNIADNVQTACEKAEEILVTGLDDVQCSAFESTLLHIGKQIAEHTGTTRVGDEFDE